MDISVEPLSHHYFITINRAIENRERGEYLWLSCLLTQTAEKIKKNITNYISTMSIVFSLLSAFSLNDLINPIGSESNTIQQTFLIFAVAEMFIMFGLLCSSVTICLYISMLKNDIDVIVEFVNRFNYWLSWYPMYGLLLSILLQICNVILRIYILQPIVAIVISPFGCSIVIYTYYSLLQVSFFVHKMFRKEWAKHNRINPIREGDSWYHHRILLPNPDPPSND